MGGSVYRDLNVSVSHLIAGEVGSKKYLVAASLKKPILLPSWVRALWEKSQQRYILAGHAVSLQIYCSLHPTHIHLLLFIWRIIGYKDVDMEPYLCPVFLGCTICVTGLSSLDRKEVQRLTAIHGGQYTGQLKMNESTHLIVQEAKGK